VVPNNGGAFGRRGSTHVCMLDALLHVLLFVMTSACYYTHGEFECVCSVGLRWEEVGEAALSGYQSAHVLGRLSAEYSRVRKFLGPKFMCLWYRRRRPAGVHVHKGVHYLVATYFESLGKITSHNTA
jgi:hypothetical protein